MACVCVDRPMCQLHGCDQPAETSVAMPSWDRAGSFVVRFACAICAAWFAEVNARRVSGLDKPDGADDDWRPSILDCVRLGMMRERADHPPAERSEPAAIRPGYNKHQLATLHYLRSLTGAHHV